MEALMKEPMEKWHACDQPYHPPGLLLLPELDSNFHGSQRRAKLLPVALTLELFPPLLQPALCHGCHSICPCSILYLAPAPQDICGPGRKKSHQRPCMVPATPQVVKGSQAQALAEEVVVLASSMEHFGDQGTHHWWSGSSQASRPCTRSMCPFNVSKDPRAQGWDHGWLCSLPSPLQKQVPANCSPSGGIRQRYLPVQDWAAA